VTPQLIRSIGVVGELIIGGLIVGRGYIERPKESAAAFVRSLKMGC
jgi:non-ribosomal peptide synthetase component F